LDGRKKAPVQKTVQKELFIQLSDEEKRIVDLLREKETITIDELRIKATLPAARQRRLY